MVKKKVCGGGFKVKKQNIIKSLNITSLYDRDRWCLNVVICGCVVGVCVRGCGGGAGGAQGHTAPLITALRSLECASIKQH